MVSWEDGRGFSGSGEVGGALPATGPGAAGDSGFATGVGVVPAGAASGGEANRGEGGGTTAFGGVGNWGEAAVVWSLLLSG